MLLDGILERNREFVHRRQPRALPAPETMPLVVVACYDPRLDPLLLPALGLEPGKAFLLRTAGALVLPGGGVLRSLGLAVFLFGATEILVVGHTSCRMATFRSTEFIDRFRARGVAREAFGTDDLREWAGAIASPRGGVQRSIETIVCARFFPPDVSVSGLVLDDASGELEVVVRDGRPVSSPAPPPLAEEPALEPEPAREEEIPSRSPGHESVAPAAHDVTPVVDAIADVVQSIEAQGKWRYESQILREQLARTRNPVAQFRLIEGFLRRATGDSREVLHALDRLRGELAAARPEALPRPLARFLRRMAGGAS
jgi:carbonic anhydrase